jgi:hypothetical protein
MANLSARLKPSLGPSATAGLADAGRWGRDRQIRSERVHFYPGAFPHKLGDFYRVGHFLRVRTGALRPRHVVLQARLAIRHDRCADGDEFLGLVVDFHEFSSKAKDPFRLAV